jgi:D-lactate dehydrogenase
MSEAPVQSRKICFVELETEGREFFAQALEAHEVQFVRSLADVPEDCEVLSIFIGERLDAAFLEGHPALKFICTRSTGCDHIDVEACRARGVKVTNVGNYGENTVAEHAFALILALARRLRESEQAVRTGHFSRDGLRGFDLRGRTMGVVGAGRVGMHVVRIALGFGMKVVAYDAEPHAFYAELLDFRYVPLGELLREADVISLHIPLNETTRHMFNRETFALCRPGAILINTARGGLVDTAAAVEALEAGRLSGLGLDVLEDERVFQEGGTAPLLGKKIAERVHAAAPGPGVRETTPARVAEFSRLVSHSRLLNRPDVILTPHVAFNSDEAVRCLRAVTLESMLDYFESKPLKHLCT